MMYGGDDVSGIVMDMGSHTCKAGYSGEEGPRECFPQEVGIVEEQNTPMLEEGQPARKVHAVGTLPLRVHRPNMRIDSAIDSNSLVRDYDLYEQLIDHALVSSLMLEPKEHPIIFTEPNIHNKEQRLKLAQFMFEKYGIPGMFICKSAVLSAFSCGRYTCLVLDSGANSTSAVPLVDGYALQNCLLQTQIGGSYLTHQFEKVLEAKGINIAPEYSFEKQFVEGQPIVTKLNLETDPSYQKYCINRILTDMKENIIKISEDPMLENSSIIEPQTMAYELPDGTNVDLGIERAKIGESLFTQVAEFPGFNGIQRMIADAITKSDTDIRKELFANIVVSGGNTLCNGLVERLQRQLPEVSPQHMRIKIISHMSSERKFSAWIGGSILSSLGSFQQMWMSKQEYEEHGAIMIERKCP